MTRSNRRFFRITNHESRSPVIILASASPRRRALLKKHGIRFRVVPSHVSEDGKRSSPKALVKHLALKKARHVSRAHPKDIVLGADTVVVLDKEILGKPLHKKEALRMLSRLSGSIHRVYTGVALVQKMRRKTLQACDVTTVKMRKLSPQQIRLAAQKHLDKAGAYAIQQKNDPFVEWIKGDYENVVGLPVKRVKQLLKKFTVHSAQCKI